MPRGGRRVGAGRKPGSISRITALRRAEPELKAIKGSAAQRAVTAAAILGLVDEVGIWIRLLEHKDPWIRLTAARYLTDRRDGRPKQAVEVSGEMAQVNVLVARLSSGLRRAEIRQIQEQN